LALLLSGKFIKTTLVALGLLLSLLAPYSASAKTSPGVATVLSIVPGLGQAANGEALEGLAWFASVFALLGSRNKMLQYSGMDAWMYNIYDGYRHAGPSGVAKQSFLSNYVATFNPLNLVDPISIPVDGIAFSQKGNQALLPGSRGYVVNAFRYGLVGLGEESLFRGTLFPEFSQMLGSKFWGAFTSSILFALGHGIGGERSALGAGPLIERSVLGMLFCWQTNMNNNDIRKSIFAHAWYDFLLSRKSMSHALVMEPRAGLKWEF
jgi:membrane protease YdiL (CAAX protease family)